MLTGTQLRSLLRAHGLRLTKRLGQHHLVDPRLIARITASCDLSPQDTVVEIGAGLGALTEPLAQQAKRVIALEIDRKIAALLTERMRAFRNVEVRHEDILRFSWKPFTPPLRAGFTGVTVVGAIPYHITSPILVSLCEARHAIRKAVLIVQREVADRLLAEPGTKAYGRLTVLGQYCWRISSLMTVSRHAFYPQPDVESRCVQLLPRSQPPVPIGGEPIFFEVVKRAFSQRRKTLANCLSGSTAASKHVAWDLTRAEAETLITALGWPASIRGEALSLDQFAALATLLARSRHLR